MVARYADLMGFTDKRPANSGKLDRVVALHLTVPTDQIARIAGLLAKGRVPLPVRADQQAEEGERVTLQ
jgi:hypothetical protein